MHYAGMSTLCAEMTDRPTPTPAWQTVAMSLLSVRGPAHASPLLVPQVNETDCCNVSGVCQGPCLCKATPSPSGK